MIAESLRTWPGRLAGLALLPSQVRRFYLAAEREARRAGDEFALVSSADPLSLAGVLHWARGSRRAAEVGTAAGWTALALALADADRRVVTVDPQPHAELGRYRGLAPDVCDRVEFVAGYGQDGPPAGERFDFLFLDEAHERAGLVAAFRAWQPGLEPGALVVFHDYVPGWPGVLEAVAELGLEGRERRNAFVWRAPG